MGTDLHPITGELSDAKRPIAKRRAETERLIQALAQIEIGTTVTYAQLSEIVQTDIQARRYMLDTAIRLLAEQRIFFLTVYGIGVQRVTPEDWITLASRYRNRIKRLSTRNERNLEHVNYRELDPRGQQEWNIEMASARLMRVASGPRITRQIQQTCIDQQAPLSVEHCHDMLVAAVRRAGKPQSSHS